MQWKYLCVCDLCCASIAKNIQNFELELTCETRIEWMVSFMLIVDGLMGLVQLTMFNTPSTKRRWGRGGFKFWPIYHLPLWDGISLLATLAVLEGPSSEPCSRRAVRHKFFCAIVFRQTYLSNPWAVKTRVNSSLLLFLFYLVSRYWLASIDYDVSVWDVCYGCMDAWWSKMDAVNHRCIM